MLYVTSHVEGDLVVVLTTAINNHNYSWLHTLHRKSSATNFTYPPCLSLE